MSFGTVLLLGLSLVGYFALTINRTNNLSTISSELSSAVTAINSYQDSPITASLSVASSSDFPLAVGLLSLDGELTIFSETEIDIRRLASSIAEKALIDSVEVGTENRYLIRAISLGDGSYVILASDLANIDYSQITLRNQIAIVIFIIMLSSLGVALLSLRKEISALRTLSIEADEITSGNLDLQFTEISGDSEVGSLSRSLSSMAKSLQNQNLEMKQLLGDISHELKTPLTAIKGYAELLSVSSAENIQDSHAIEILNTEINHMTRLVEDILLMSRLGAISYELNDKVDLSNLVHKRFRILEELQPGRAITLIDECEQEIEASEVLIIRLLDNLVSNALTHTDPDDSIIVTTCTDSEYWTIQYEDSGPGLPDQYLVETDFSFSRFDSRASFGKGNGLGLSIIKAISAQHGGSMTLGTSYLGGLLLRVSAPIK